VGRDAAGAVRGFRFGQARAAADPASTRIALDFFDENDERPAARYKLTLGDSFG
jgi:hypothetical protein